MESVCSVFSATPCKDLNQRRPVPRLGPHASHGTHDDIMESLYIITKGDDKPRLF